MIFITTARRSLGGTSGLIAGGATASISKIIKMINSKAIETESSILHNNTEK